MNTKQQFFPYKNNFSGIKKSVLSLTNFLTQNKFYNELIAFFT
jgi:hypothetical protein